MARSPSDIAKQLRRIAAGISSAQRPDRTKVVRALKSVIAAMNPGTDVKAIYQCLYGRTTPWHYVDAENASVDDMAGSSLFWAAFEELGVVDWYPGIDPKPVFDKCDEYKQMSMDERADDPDELIDLTVRDNYDDYVKLIQPEHIEKLKAAGLWT